MIIDKRLSRDEQTVIRVSMSRYRFRITNYIPFITLFVHSEAEVYVISRNIMLIPFMPVSYQVPERVAIDISSRSA